ncbi:MAG: fluoride efflux transporter CrcB [Thiotrichales bacterium]|nr:fluoride efflux transporter CrcB [Thiotrichales bacterium]MCY4284888.1 fluoride efflux transporter CrcB [Thiotrichales bacterium]
MRTMVAVAMGGALGALMRLWVAQGVHALLGRGFPFGTLVVNVLGSLAMGVVYVLCFERFDIPPEWRAALIVGFLGAFTTFSTFSMDTLLLIQQGEHARAGMNVVLSVVLCLAGAWLGMVAARQF